MMTVSQLFNEGWCQCGCGERTAVAKWSDKRIGVTRGQHYRFIRGHYYKTPEARKKRSDQYTGSGNPKWHGGHTVGAHNNRLIYAPDHPNYKCQYVLAQRLIMEQHLGRYLTADEAVIHLDNDSTNNDLNNLRIVSRAEQLTIARQSKKNKPC